jgi:integrase
MRGTILRYEPKRGRPTFGYSFFAGRDENGKRIQKVKRGFVTKGEAEEALREAIAHAGGLTEQKKASEKTFAELFEEWMQKYVRRDCARKTAEAYREHGAYALRRIGHLKLDQLQNGRNLLEDMIQEIADSGGIATKEHPKGRPLSRKTVRHIGFVVRGCFNYAVHRQYLKSNPMDGVRLPKLEKNRKPKIAEKEEFQAALRRASGTRLFPQVVFAHAVGCRRGELLAITWLDIDFDFGIATIDKSLEETKEFGLRVKCTKSGNPRYVELPAYVLKVLADWRKVQDKDRELCGADYAGHNLVFCRPDGEYYVPSQVGARVSKLMRKVGLRLSLHSLRHSHASGMLSKGVPAATVAERLGHANAGITLGIYAHALKSDKHAAAAIWDDEMGHVVEEAMVRPGERMSSNVINKSSSKLQVIEKKRA